MAKSWQFWLKSGKWEPSLWEKLFLKNTAEIKINQRKNNLGKEKLFLSMEKNNLGKEKLFLSMEKIFCKKY